MKSAMIGKLSANMDVKLFEATLISHGGVSDSCATAKDLLLYWQPDHAAFQAAAVGGPHFDTFGGPDPRTYAHIVTCLTQPLAGQAPPATQRLPVCQYPHHPIIYDVRICLNLIHKMICYMHWMRC